jgi:hypothetical protein
MTNDEERLEAQLQGSRGITADYVRTAPTSALLAYWSSVVSALEAFEEQGLTEQAVMESAEPPLREMWKEIRRAAALVCAEIDRRIPAPEYKAAPAQLLSALGDGIRSVSKHFCARCGYGRHVTLECPLSGKPIEVGTMPDAPGIGEAEAPEHPDKPARPLSDLLQITTADGVQLELRPCKTEPGLALSLKGANNSLHIVLYPEQAEALVEALMPALPPAVDGTQVPVGEDIAKLFEEALDARHIAKLFEEALRARHITYMQRDQFLSIAEGEPQDEVGSRIRDALEEVARRLFAPACPGCGRPCYVHAACNVCDRDE